MIADFHLKYLLIIIIPTEK